MQSSIAIDRTQTMKAIIQEGSGSADVLKALGVNVEAPANVVERCLDELGICFCFAALALLSACELEKVAIPSTTRSVVMHAVLSATSPDQIVLLERRRSLLRRDHER